MTTALLILTVVYLATMAVFVRVITNANHGQPTNLDRSDRPAPMGATTVPELGAFYVFRGDGQPLCIDDLPAVATQLHIEAHAWLHTALDTVLDDVAAGEAATGLDQALERITNPRDPS